MTELKSLDHKQIKRLLENAANLNGVQKRSALEELGKTLFKDRDIVAEAKSEQEDEIEHFLKEVKELLDTSEAVQHFEIGEDEDKNFADIIYLSSEECYLYAPILLSKIADIEQNMVMTST